MPSPQPSPAMEHYLLPNTYNIGFTVSYIPLSSKPLLLKEPLLQSDPIQLVSWVSKPAIYIPQVLAVTDELVTLPRICNAPVVVDSIPSQDINIETTIQVDTSTAFSSETPLTHSQVNDTIEYSVTIDPTTGLVTIEATEDSPPNFNVTVTATNTCGSVSTTFLVVPQ